MKPVTVTMEDPYAGRLSKRLCYLLRYGAIKEGFTVHEGGFVDIKEVLHHRIMRHHTETEVIQEIDSSLSHRRTKRFERKVNREKTLVRARFCRKFEQSTVHEGTQVPTLLHQCIVHVSNNLSDYDLEDFPDEFIIMSMINQLKKEKKLNSNTFRQLLVPALEHLDLSSIYVTQSTLRAIYTGCPYLKVLSLKDCGYIVTDNVVQIIVKKLPHLESLSLAACKHLTDRATSAICKFGKNIRELNLSWIRTISEGGILDLVLNCDNLNFLDIYDFSVQGEIRDLIIEGARQRGIKVVLKGLETTEPDVTIENPSMMLPNFGKVM